MSAVLPMFREDDTDKLHCAKRGRPNERVEALSARDKFCWTIMRDYMHEDTCRFSRTGYDPSSLATFEMKVNKFIAQAIKSKSDSPETLYNFGVLRDLIAVRLHPVSRGPSSVDKLPHQYMPC